MEPNFTLLYLGGLACKLQGNWSLTFLTRSKQNKNAKNTKRKMEICNSCLQLFFNHKQHLQLFSSQSCTIGHMWQLVANNMTIILTSSTFRWSLWSMYTFSSFYYIVYIQICIRISNYTVTILVTFLKIPHGTIMNIF
jgi:hypothetical protein